MRKLWEHYRFITTMHVYCLRNKLVRLHHMGDKDRKTNGITVHTAVSVSVKRTARVSQFVCHPFLCRWRKATF